MRTLFIVKAKWAKRTNAGKMTNFAAVKTNWV